MAGVITLLDQPRTLDALGRATDALIYFYLTGTTVLANIYNDEALTDPAVNPIDLAAGEIFPDIYLDPSVVYRRRILYGDGTIHDVDPLPGAGSASGDSVSFIQAGTGAVERTIQDKAREVVSITDYGAHPDATAAVNTAAIQKAMTYLLDRFPDSQDYYPGGPGDPTDFYDTDRQTGLIHIPAGRYFVQPNTFSSLSHPRAPFCGFVFQGDHKMSSILLLETGGVESWFYNNTISNPNRYQQIHWRDIGFRSDDYRFGNVAKVWSNGGPKQFLWTDCDFQYLQKFLYTEGTGNADLTKISRCTGHFYSDIITVNNDQSVQHDFIGSDIGTYGHIMRVKQLAGGNINVINASIDFVWHEDYSPVGGNYMFYEDDNAVIGQGNCTFKFEDCRVEVEAYKRTAGAPPFGIVRFAAAATNSFPRVLFNNVNFVNGHTYTIDAGGNITGQDYRRITAVLLVPRKHAVFQDCILLKTFFYEANGDRDTGSPNIGGICFFDRCYDGTTAELPAADTAKELLATRVTYTGSAGRFITKNCSDHTTGSSLVRKMDDSDANWYRQFGREPSAEVRLTSFKHFNNAWPFADNASGDSFIDIPPGLRALRVYVYKPAQGAVTNAYQLHLKATDRTGATIASSTLAQFKDAHTIDLSHIDWSAYTRVCLCASGTGTDFDNGGWGYVMHL